jgi:hypothetical protein
VSTRKLIAVALLCGLAILVAGGIQLFRISDRSQRTVDVLEQGQPATVGGITLTVVRSERTDGETTATVHFAPSSRTATFDLDEFTLLSGGHLERPTNADANEGDCSPLMVVGDQQVVCQLRFAPHEGTATLSFSHGGEQRLWRLDLSSS